MLKPSLPTLVDICIECDDQIGDDDGDGLSYALLGGLYHELEKMAGQNVVETIKLTIWVSPGNDCTRWGELDDILMGSPEGWPALKKVSLTVNVEGTYTGTYMDSPDKVVEELQEISMIKLMESKRVQFDFQVSDRRR